MDFLKRSSEISETPKQNHHVEFTVSELYWKSYSMGLHGPSLHL